MSLQVDVDGDDGIPARAGTAQFWTVHPVIFRLNLLVYLLRKSVSAVIQWVVVCLGFQMTQCNTQVRGK